MITLRDLVDEPDRLEELGETDVIIAAPGTAEVVVRDQAPTQPKATMVFMHETIAMMRAQRAAQVDKLREVVGLDSMVVPLVKKPGSMWSHITVGRASTADIVVNDPAMSNLHAHFEIDLDDHPVSVQDVGSSNGTFVNREPLQPHAPVKLNSGDCVRFGQTVFYYIGRSILRDLVTSYGGAPVH